MIDNDEKTKQAYRNFPFNIFYANDENNTSVKISEKYIELEAETHQLWTRSIFLKPGRPFSLKGEQLRNQKRSWLLASVSSKNFQFFVNIQQIMILKTMKNW